VLERFRDLLEPCNMPDRPEQTIRALAPDGFRTIARSAFYVSWTAALTRERRSA
jgi:hypothetical protein